MALIKIKGMHLKNIHIEHRHQIPTKHLETAGSQNFIAYCLKSKIKDLDLYCRPLYDRLKNATNRSDYKIE
jgi:hypothetical protein